MGLVPCSQAVCQWCFVLGCSSSPPLVWTWILAIVSCFGGVVVSVLYLSVQDIFVLCVSCHFDCLILCISIVSLHQCLLPFGFQPLLVCFWFEKHALVFCHFFPPSKIHFQGSRDDPVLLGRKLTCYLIYQHIYFRITLMDFY